MFKYGFIVFTLLTSLKSFAAVDPTKPLFGVKKSAAIQQKNKLVLQSVFNNTGKRTAIINGQLVKQGEELGGYKVIKIDDTQVALRSSEGQITLKLFAGTVKK